MGYAHGIKRVISMVICGRTIEIQSSAPARASAEPFGARPFTLRLPILLLICPLVRTGLDDAFSGGLRKSKGPFEKHLEKD